MNNLIKDKRLKPLEEIIKYNFQDKNLFLKSLIHTSASKEKISSMERFEFLGDRVLGLIISEELFIRYPNLKEGELSKKYSFLVQRTTCAIIAKKINLEDFIILGKSENINQKIKKSILFNIKKVFSSKALIFFKKFSSKSLIDFLQSISRKTKSTSFKIS